MQLFPCPFCGLRSETEFRFGGDAGNVRPEGFRDVSAADWSRYLFERNNSRGEAHEIWVHATCGELFRMDRDTVTHEVLAVHALAGEDRA